MWTPGLSEARQASEGPLESGATLVYTGTFLLLAVASPPGGQGADLLDAPPQFSVQTSWRITES